jgi:hypothetical protein
VPAARVISSSATRCGQDPAVFWWSRFTGRRDRLREIRPRFAFGQPCNAQPADFDRAKAAGSIAYEEIKGFVAASQILCFSEIGSAFAYTQV